MIRRIGRWLVGVAVATMVDVGLFVWLVHAADWPVVAADVVALTLAAAVSVAFHRLLTFSGDPYARWLEHPLRVTGTVVAAGVLDVLVVIVLLELFGQSLAALVVAKLIAVAVAAMLRAVLYRRALSELVRTDFDQRRQRPAPPGTQRLSVVIPAYGEEDRIESTLGRLREALAPIDDSGGLELIVVDDGSSDATAAVAEGAGASRVVRLPTNQGKGAAVRAGVLSAVGRTVAFTDADLAYSPEHLLTLLEGVEDGWDVVVGSRRHTDTHTLVRAGRLREIGGRAVNLLTQLALLGQHRDTQCGLKAFRSDVARAVFGRTRIDGFAFDVEIFYLVERYRLSLLEVPVRVENSERSTVRVVSATGRLLRDLFRIRAWARDGGYELDDETRLALLDDQPMTEAGR